MTALQVTHIERATRAEGPGIRWAIWVQGCSIGCAGCCNPHTWGPNGGQRVDVSDLIAEVTDAPVEGITLLGGEPFDQAPALAVLASAAQDAGLGVMTFTGYRYEMLLRGTVPGWSDLLDTTDLLVDGPYLRGHRDMIRPWVGSTNQRLIHLSDRYRDGNLPDACDRIELRIRRDGSVAVNGWPETLLVEALEQLLDDMGERPDPLPRAE